jgi:hypothetical protein
MRTGPIVVVLALVLEACGGGGATREVRAPVANQPAPEAHAARPRLTLEDALRMMPADTEIVGELDLARLRQSIIWERIEPWLRQQGGAELDEFARTCEFDPVDAFDTVLVGGRGLGAATEMTIFVRGLSEEKARTCIERAAAAAREHGENKRVRVDGDRIVLLEGGQASIVLEFVDPQTMLLAVRGSHSFDERLLDETLARRDKGGLDRSSPLYGLIGRVDTTATVWFAVDGNAPSMGSMPYSLGGMRVEVQTGSDPARAVISSLVLELHEPDDAPALAGMFRIVLDGLKGNGFDDVVQAVVVTEEQANVVVEMRLEMAQLERLAALIAPMFP